MVSGKKWLLRLLWPGFAGSLEFATNPAYAIRNSAFGIRNSAFSIRHSAFGIRNSAFSIRNSEFGIKKGQKPFGLCQLFTHKGALLTAGADRGIGEPGAFWPWAWESSKIYRGW